jgi:DNA ligase D-like protein (predicted ligase)
MLATSGPVPEGPGWAFEFRWDGLRSIATVQRGRVRLHSAEQREISASYPELGVLADRVGRRGVLLDGKIVALDGYGRPSLGPLRRRMNAARPSEALLGRVPVAYYVFDVLHADGRSLLGMPYAQRRQRLGELDLAGGPVVLPPSFTDTAGQVMVETATRYGLDGVVAKRLDSPYRPGRRSRSWVETTLRPSIEVLVGGWTPAADSTAAGGEAPGTPGALLVGVPTEQGLSFIGRVRSGLDAAARRRMAGAFRGLGRSTSPFFDELPDDATRGARWVYPRLVGEVCYRHWTEQGRLAYPVWRGLRTDVHPAAVRPAVVLHAGASLSAEPVGSSAAAAELRALREQISPHFVYNALNTVASLVRTDPGRARELLAEFADYTRYAFRSAADLAPLGDELDAVAQYLALEQARFGRRLRTELRIAPAVRAAPVPFLALQSLVVDAVRQGIEPAPSGGSLVVRAEAGSVGCVVTVSDDGVRRAEGAVRDVAERLRTAFGERARVDLGHSAAGTTVTLHLPDG